MTKAEIVREVSKSTGIEATTVSAVVEGFMSTVKNSLSEGENVYRDTCKLPWHNVT